MKADFPHLSRLIGTYFHQDYDLIADDLESLMADFARNAPAATQAATRLDILRYLDSHSTALAEAFRSDYGFDVDPELWGYTAEAFLRKLADSIGA